MDFGLSVNPDHLILEPNETEEVRVSWRSEKETVQIYLSINGEPARLFAAESTSGYETVSGIHEGDYWVFLMYKGTNRSKLLDWTSVTTQRKPEKQFGFCYAPQNHETDAYCDALFAKMRPEIQKELMEMSCLGADYIRIVFSTSMGTSINRNGWHFNPCYYESIKNLLTFLYDCYTFGMKVDIVFSNEHFTQGHYQQLDWKTFKTGSTEFINNLVNAIEADPIARRTVILYCYQNEVNQKFQGMWDYINHIYDNTRIPMGKRAISIADKHSTEPLRKNTRNRRFDYILLDFYHNDQFNYDSDMRHLQSHAKSQFLYSKILSSEVTYKPDASDEEKENLRALLYIHNIQHAADVYRRLQPGFRGEIDYTPHKPKDLYGAYVSLNSLVENPDCEMFQDDFPVGWNISKDTPGNISIKFSDTQDAATGDSFIRVTTNGQNGRVVVKSNMFRVRSCDTMFLNFFVRGNVRNIYPLIKEYNASGELVVMNAGPLVTAILGDWTNYQYAVGPWACRIQEDTIQAALEIRCDADEGKQQTLDIDTVAMWTKPACITT